ncbi:MAG: putative hydroxymethylpyrimidine transporter CytX [Clostridium sp.]
MQKTETSIFSNGLIWFGAAISIAEILTGTLIAPLGFGRGCSAIILGHLIGCVLLYLAGLIGAKTEKSAMETVKISFGERGALLFSSLNVLQLVGWTAVMIVSGAAAASSVIKIGGDWVWSLIIGTLIIVWILIGIKNLGKINIVAVGGLFVLTIVMSVVVFRGNMTGLFGGVAAMTGGAGAAGVAGGAGAGLSFGAAVELSVAMPLSWLPLISDYTCTAKKKKATTLVSTAVYFVGSCWMYLIGMGAAIFTGESDIAKIMVSAGLGIAGLIIIIFSTVTTTFLDVYSAGISCVSISAKTNEKVAAVAVCIIGMLLAVFTPITQFESFLYLIGSVFAPMIAILITDVFLLKKDHSGTGFNGTNLTIWLLGFIIYRIFMNIDTPVGNTLPVMVIVSMICIMVNKLFKGKRHV